MTTTQSTDPSRWTFTEDQRDAVCSGKLCPVCQGTHVKNVGTRWDGRNVNAAFDCLDCGAQWEGY